MTDEAIEWVKFQQAMTPDKPFLIYHAPGAVHAPHHAPKNFIEKYDGQFNEGWLAYRQQTFERQKAMGVIPADAKLAPMPTDIKQWEALSDQERELFTLQMEAFAGFTEHTDRNVGRLVDAIDDIGVLDDTLFIYIMSDNGSSGEGGLFNTEDFSLTNNLAAQHPDKLREMQDLFEKEAIANNVYPLDDRLYERFNAAIAGRPDLMGTRTSLTLADGMTGILENTFINEKNRSKTIVANVDLKGNDRGVILTQGGKFGGWALYMDGGKPAYTYNWFGLERYMIEAPEAITSDNAEIKLQFDYDEGEGIGLGGMASLYVDGEKVAEGRVDKTQSAVYSADETADVGMDEATQSADLVFKDVEDSEFTGFVNSVTISIPES